MRASLSSFRGAPRRATECFHRVSGGVFHITEEDYYSLPETEWAQLLNLCRALERVQHEVGKGANVTKPLRRVLQERHAKWMQEQKKAGIVGGPSPSYAPTPENLST